GVDLLAAIVADPKARAVDVLTHAGVDADELQRRIEDGLLALSLLERGHQPEGGAAQPAPEGCGTSVGGGDPAR
ncbi:Clp protease N-terminal domain-containing protein, partial [Streptomyces sp. NPDC002491]